MRASRGKIEQTHAHKSGNQKNQKVYEAQTRPSSESQKKIILKSEHTHSSQFKQSLPYFTINQLFFIGFIKFYTSRFNTAY